MTNHFEAVRILFGVSHSKLRVCYHLHRLLGVLSIDCEIFRDCRRSSVSERVGRIVRRWEYSLETVGRGRGLHHPNQEPNHTKTAAEEHDWRIVGLHPPVNWVPVDSWSTRYSATQQAYCPGVARDRSGHPPRGEMVLDARRNPYRLPAVFEGSLLLDHWGKDSGLGWSERQPNPEQDWR